MRCRVGGRRERAEKHLQARRGNAAAATPTSRKAVGGPLNSNPAATAAAAAAVAIDTPRGVYAPNNSGERLFVAAAPTLLRLPTARPQTAATGGVRGRPAAPGLRARVGISMGTAHNRTSLAGWGGPIFTFFAYPRSLTSFLFLSCLFFGAVAQWPLLAGSPRRGVKLEL